MSQMDKLYIEELLNGYIDDELTDRERTEVKRLIKHDRVIAEELAQLQKIRQLLGAVPIETAPEGLLDDVKRSLERQFILKDLSKDSAAAAGARHLLLRRVLTAAAMLILPLGVLAWVVFGIIMPEPAPDKTAAARTVETPDGSAGFKGGPLVASDSPTQPADESVQAAKPFNAAITMKTNESIAVNAFLEKAIYNNGLYDYMIPKRQADRSSYRISCRMDKAIALLSDLNNAWDRCKFTSLAVYGEKITPTVLVDDVRLEQVITVFKYDRQQRSEIAKDLSRFNAMVADMPGRNILDTMAKEQEAEFALSIPVEPILTSNRKTSNAESRRQTDETIVLTITVTDM